MFCVIVSYILKNRFNIHIWVHKEGNFILIFFIPYFSIYLLLFYSSIGYLLSSILLENHCEISRKDLY